MIIPVGFKEANMQLLKYKTILKLASDNPHSLRLVDVDRVMSAANEQGCLDDFTKWLLEHLNRSRFNQSARIQRLKAKIKNWESQDAMNQDNQPTNPS